MTWEPSLEEQIEHVRHSMEFFTGLWPQEITSEALEKAGCQPTVAVLPKDFDERIRYLGNLLVQMVLSRKGGDARLRMELATLASSLSYLLNSSSFASGEYMKYDEIEIGCKLRRVP